MILRPPTHIDTTELLIYTATLGFILGSLINMIWPWTITGKKRDSDA